MRKVLTFGLATAVTATLFGAGELSARTYNLFVHGRSGENHCTSITSASSATNDYRNYWGGSVSGVSNVRYIGFDGTKSGGAYAWGSCGAQKQMNDAVNTFCRNGNDCNIYTHSTGGLVVAYYFGQYGASGLNIRSVRLMANAAGGSELADISTSYLAWLGFDTLGGELDDSVSTSGARSWNHYNSGGLTFYTTSGESSDYLGVTNGFLPGEDDGVLANHSLCNVNEVYAVDKACPSGNGSFDEPYGCGWFNMSTCYKRLYRWTPYRTLFVRASDTHSDAKRHYN